ncbi:MAG: flagellar motor switch protein FliM [Betaproteobacteria bacterium]|nr:flagellar motor switch protein FliM [Betaproteobacteria bacterium]
MAKDFLSQDEVDALLRGVTGEVDEVVQQDDGSGIRPYNLATQERIVRGRMPTLEIINERFARLLRIGLFNLIRRTAEISVGPVRVLKYSEFVRNLVVPTNLNLVQAKPLRGTGLFIFDPNLVFLFVDNMFGGDGRFHTRVEGRDFTQVEQRIIQRMLGVAFEEYQKSWAPVYPLKFEYVRSEMNTQFANIATPNEIVVATTFTIELEATGGEFHICLPYSLLEPIRDLIYSTMQADHMEADRRWITLLRSQVQLAEVELVATISEFTLNISDLVAMKVGDVIPCELKDRVLAEVDGVPVLDCRYGICNGRYALKVDRLVNPASLSPDPGDHHG